MKLIILFSVLSFVNPSYSLVWLQNSDDKVTLSCKGQQIDWLNIKKLPKFQIGTELSEADIRNNIIKEDSYNVEFNVYIETQLNEMVLDPFGPRWPKFNEWGWFIFDSPIDEAEKYQYPEDLLLENSIGFKSKESSYLYSGNINRYTGEIEIYLESGYSVGQIPSGYRQYNPDEFYYELKAICARPEKLF